jgi:hypothetical protein
MMTPELEGKIRAEYILGPLSDPPPLYVPLTILAMILVGLLLFVTITLTEDVSGPIPSLTAGSTASTADVDE